MNNRLFTCAGGATGVWRIAQMKTIVGEPLPQVEFLNITSETLSAAPGTQWLLRGITSNERYVERDEKNRLAAKQPALGRPEAVRAALIPIRKNALWWSLTQDERRKVFERRSHHIDIGLRYLPAVARRLHHCRDLGENEPFDFLTWFEYAPGDEAAFNTLLTELRASQEWTYVDREIDIRLARDPA